MIAVDLVAGCQASTLRSAALWSALWIGVSVAFGFWAIVQFGRDPGTQYFAAYVLEKSLSGVQVDVGPILLRREQ